MILPMRCTVSGHERLRTVTNAGKSSQGMDGSDSYFWVLCIEVGRNGIGIDPHNIISIDERSDYRDRNEYEGRYGNNHLREGKMPILALVLNKTRKAFFLLDAVLFSLFRKFY